LAWRGVGWIRLAQDRDRWRTVVSAVMNLRILAPRSYLVRGTRLSAIKLPFMHRCDQLLCLQHIHQSLWHFISLRKLLNLVTHCFHAQLDAMILTGKWTLWRSGTNGCNLLENAFFQVVNGAKLVHECLSLQQTPLHRKESESVKTEGLVG
jgi:hypothetical protein